MSLPSESPPPKGVAPRGKLKMFALKLGLLSFTSIVCLFILEFAIRVCFPYYNPRNQLALRYNEEGVVVGPMSNTSIQGTPKGDFKITVSFNQHGFRDTKDFTQATTNDIFVAGDSFSIGWGVEEGERYSSLLEKKLGKKVYNVAIPEDIRGYERTLRYVTKRGAPVRSVIIGLCMENDLWDYDLPVSNNVLYEKQMIRGFRHKTAVWIKRRSALWTCASYNIQKHAALRSLFEKIGISRNIDQLTHKNEATPQILETSRDQLLKVATNYNSIILIIPSRALWYGSNQEVEQTVHEKFVGSLRTSGLQVVDMKPELEGIGNPLDFYFKNDPHWNVKGHTAAADALMNYLGQSAEWKTVLGSEQPARVR